MPCEFDDNSSHSLSPVKLKLAVVDDSGEKIAHNFICFVNFYQFLLSGILIMLPFRTPSGGCHRTAHC